MQHLNGRQRNVYTSGFINFTHSFIYSKLLNTEHAKDCLKMINYVIIIICLNNLYNLNSSHSKINHLH